MSTKINLRFDGEPPDMSLENWILAIIHDKDDRRSRDALTLMNETFIFVKEVLPAIENDFDFERKIYGPYSIKVAGSVKQLLSNNILEIIDKGSLKLIQRVYNLTDSGAERAQKLFSALPEELRDKMDLMNTATNNMGDSGMLQYIYSIYPEYVYLDKRGRNIV